MQSCFRNDTSTINKMKFWSSIPPSQILTIPYLRLIYDKSSWNSPVSSEKINMWNIYSDNEDNDKQRTNNQRRLYLIKHDILMQKINK